MRVPLLICFLSLAALTLAACDDSGEAAGSGLTAVATTTIAGDLLRNVGGDRVAVRTLLGPNADPHGYEPRPSDVRSISEAALVVKSGGDVDDWLDDLIENAGGDAEELTLIDSVPIEGGQAEENGGEAEGGEGQAREGADPHWWQDPRNAVLAVRAIERSLVGLHPDSRATYERTADAYVKRLRSLDRATAASMRKGRGDRRNFVTTPAALGYCPRP